MERTDQGSTSQDTTISAHLAEEDWLELEHACNGEQDRWVLWDQRRTGQALVATPLPERQEGLPDLSTLLRG